MSSLFNPFGANANPAQGQVPSQMVATPATGQVAASSANGAPTNPSAAPIPFIQAAKDHVEIGQNYSGKAFGSNLTINVPAYGYLEGLVLEVQGVGGVNGSVTVTESADGPWDVIAQLLLSDPSGLQIANVTGYEWYLIQRYSAKSLFAIEADTNSFSDVSTGASGTGNFDIRLPLDLGYGQGGRGSLADSNQAATFKAQVTLAPAATLYGATPPGTPPTMQGQLESINRMIPQPADIYQRPQTTVPPIPGSYVVYSTQQQAVVNGGNTLFLSRVGNVLRFIILVFRDSTGSRAGAVSGGTFPAQIEMDWDTGVKYIITSKTLQQRVFRKTGLIVPAGVLPFLFTANDKAGGLFVGDDGTAYVPTVGGTKIKFSWPSTTGGGSVDVIVCDIVSRDGGVAVSGS